MLVPSADTAPVDLDGAGSTPGGLRPADLLGRPDLSRRFGGGVLSTTLAAAGGAAGRCADNTSDRRLAGTVHLAAGIGDPAGRRAAGWGVTDRRGEVASAGWSGLVVAADAETHAALASASADGGRWD